MYIFDKKGIKTCSILAKYKLSNYSWYLIYFDSEGSTFWEVEYLYLYIILDIYLYNNKKSFIQISKIGEVKLLRGPVQSYY